MITIELLASDLELLQTLTPDLDFSDAERQEVLLEGKSRDFNAVPGNGKTSLLAAKLLLLAHKWSYQNKGICILSHTNVAREEILRRITKTSEDSSLLNYPHFIGTIHGFINQFLAVPALRALGLHIDTIDDDIFAKRATSILKEQRFSVLKGWLRRRQNGDALVSTLYYEGNSLDVASEKGLLPGKNSDSGKQLAAIKSELAKAGVFRHRDMFSFAKMALSRCPDLLDIAHRRFPVVFIDEMQDTSQEQEEILNQLFDGKSIVQRFGDVDQKILSNDAHNEKVTFPRPNHGTVSTSKRFGGPIADAVSKVRLSGLPVKGDASHNLSPVLLLYNTADVDKVILRFGQLVIDRFDVASLYEKPISAMCARKPFAGTAIPGRHLADYWPMFARVQNSETLGSPTSFWRAIDAMRAQKPGYTLAERANETRQVVFQVLCAAQAPVTLGIRTGRALVCAIEEKTGSASEIQHLILELTLNLENFTRKALVNTLYKRLAYLLPLGMTKENFESLAIFSQPELTSTITTASTVCQVDHANQNLKISLGTVASMKGETHLASLVLESYSGKSRKFDIEVFLPYIAGLINDFSRLTNPQRFQMRNLYVAMSRPTHFLCLAANKLRVSNETFHAIGKMGWSIEYMTTAQK